MSRAVTDQWIQLVMRKQLTESLDQFEDKGTHFKIILRFILKLNLRIISDAFSKVNS